MVKKKKTKNLKENIGLKKGDIEDEWKKLKGKLLLDLINQKEERVEKETKEVIETDIDSNIDSSSFAKFIEQPISFENSKVVLDKIKDIRLQSNLEQNMDFFTKSSREKFKFQDNFPINKPKYIGEDNRYITSNNVEPTALRPSADSVSFTNIIKKDMVNPFSGRQGFNNFSKPTPIEPKFEAVDNKKYLEKDSR